MIQFQAFSQIPDWTVNPADYSEDMVMTGVVSIFGEEIRGEDHILGAFVEDECRGVAKPIYIESFDRYYMFLQVRSNEVKDEIVTFKFYDAIKELQYSLVNVDTFLVGKVQGNFNDPYIFTNVDSTDTLSVFRTYEFLDVDEDSIHIDTVNREIFIKVPGDAEMSSLIANFTFDDDSYSAYIGNELQLTGVTANNFKDTVQYVVVNKYGFETLWKVMVKPLVLLQSVEKVSEISIYPNPATDYISIDGVQNYNHCTAIIFDTRGSVIESKNLRDNMLDVDGLKEGAYVLVILDGTKKVFESKFLIKR